MLFNIFAEEKNVGEIFVYADANYFKVVKTHKLTYIGKLMNGLETSKDYYRVDIKPTDKKFFESWDTGKFAEPATIL